MIVSKALLRSCTLIALMTLAAGVSAVAQTPYRQIIIAEHGHPAIRSAAEIIARKLSIPESNIKTSSAPMPAKGDIVLLAAPATAEQMRQFGDRAKSISHDGYLILFGNGGALIFGNRPRSLLYAAGDWRLWKDKTSGRFVREPAFAIRSAQYEESRSVAENVAELGVNILIGKPNDATVTLKETLPEVYQALSVVDQERLERSKSEKMKQNLSFARACRDADVSFYAFLYGNDFTLWSPTLYQAALKVYPTIKGTPEPSSWEKAYLCPSDPLTWKLIRAYVQEFAAQTEADGVYATFWDRYGIYCQDDRCQRSGLNKFPNELYECVKQYEAALRPLNRKLVVRTWSSGVPHWLRDEFVHAPGYGSFRRVRPGFVGSSDQGSAS